MPPQAEIKAMQANDDEEDFDDCTFEIKASQKRRFLFHAELKKGVKNGDSKRSGREGGEWILCLCLAKAYSCE